MPSAAEERVREALRAMLAQAVRYHARSADYGSVVGVDPVRVELHDEGHTISEEEDLVLGHEVRQYIADYGPLQVADDDGDGGDTLAVTRMSDGDWVAVAVLHDSEVGPAGPGLTTGTRATRPSANAVLVGTLYYATDNGITYQSDGVSTWTAVNWVARRVTAVPTSPAPEDGQLINLVADDLLGIVWRFRYNAESPASRKWEFDGGPPLTKWANSGESVADSSGAWVDLSATGAVPIVIPTLGDYLIEAVVNVAPSSSAQVALAVWSGPNGSGGAAVTTSVSFSGTGDGIPVSIGVQRVDALAAGTIRLRGNTNSASVTYLTELIRVTPVRV